MDQISTLEIVKLCLGSGGLLAILGFLFLLTFRTGKIVEKIESMDKRIEKVENAIHSLDQRMTRIEAFLHWFEKFTTRGTGT